MRVALYARYSSDLQNQRSAEDQFAALRLVVQARGWQEVAAFSDLGISGANLNNRPGVQTLLREAERGAFDVVFTEALDRLSRDQEGTAHLYKRLSYYGAALETLSEGRISELHVGLSGTMNQLFLVELGKKTRRGLIGRVKEGFSGGGRCYGYQIVEGQTGVFEVDPHQASVVTRICRDYAAGRSPRQIAHALNAEGEPGPRGGDWTPSAIYGDRRARDGILCQELYIGVRVYNRRSFKKHPDTARRSGRLNPESEWLREPVPELRIIDDGLWSAVQDRQKAISEQPAQFGRKPKRLLSGLMKCSLCGSGMTLNGQKFACSAARERGTCTNTKIIAAKTIEARVLDGIAAKLLAPEAIAAAVGAAQTEATARQHQTLKARAPMEKELAEIARKLERAQTMCMDGAMEIAELKARSAPLKARRAELEGLLAEAAEPAALSLHPGVAEAYRRMAEQLRAAMDEVDGEDARDAVRSLIDQVVFIPVEGLGKFELEIQGNLARLLRISGVGPQTHKSPAASGSGAFAGSHRCEVLVGAGAGFEPATFRL
jgi:site-specific DNA recombinase